MNEDVLIDVGTIEVTRLTSSVLAVFDTCRNAKYAQHQWGRATRDVSSCWDFERWSCI